MNVKFSIGKRRCSWRKYCAMLLLPIILFLSLPTQVVMAAKPVQPPMPVSISQTNSIRFRVSQDGMYRVTYEDMLVTGLNLKGTRPTDIALENRGFPVPLYISSGRTFGPGAYIEFYGQALDTLYTKENVYHLVVNRSLARRIEMVKAAPGSSVVPAAYYMEELRSYENHSYNIGSPTNDPWFMAQLAAATSLQKQTYNINLDDYQPGAAPASITLDLYGLTEYSQNPDHHLLVSLNGQNIIDGLFDGKKVISFNASDLPVVAGANTLEIFLPGDTGARYDSVILEGFEINYPRAYLARDGQLDFDASGGTISASGFPGSEIIVYRVLGETPVRLTNTTVAQIGSTYTVSFSATQDQAHYWVVSSDRFLKPVVEPGPQTPDLIIGKVDYMMISHPDFINGLEPLVNARQAQGYSVQVMDVKEIYNQYSNGIIDPQAIRKFIAFAKEKLGTQYVLLVGGDSYDYHNNLGMGNMSFIPTLYAPTDSLTFFSPADPLYADTNGDTIPDLALGRLPVRNTSQLAAIIQKTLAYEQKTYTNTSVFSSDLAFSSYSNAWAASIPEDWNKQFANLDQSPVDVAKSTLVSGINNGTALVSYFGHSTASSWTSKGLFTVQDIPNLGNHGKPFVVTQFGCWNSYFVNPNQDSLGQQFLFAEDRGASAVLGSSTNNFLHSQNFLGQFLFPKLTTPGTTIGQALLSVKQYMGANLSYFPEIQLGWTILGDPTLVIQP